MPVYVCLFACRRFSCVPCELNETKQMEKDT